MANINLESIQIAVQEVVDLDHLEQSNRHCNLPTSNFTSDAQFSLHQSDAPINNIPIEILRKIMECCSNDYGVTIPISLSRTPWSLTHVCSLWREIVLTTPELWDKLRIFREPNGQFNINVIEEVLKRNLYSPMDISLQWNNRNPVPSVFHRQGSSFLPALCHTIFREGIKVRRLTLKPETRVFPELQNQLEAIPASVFDSIEEVTLVFLGEMPDIPIITTHPLWTAPRLTIGTSTRWSGFFHRDLINQLNTSHITSLSFPKLTAGPQILYTLLRDSPLLASLDITVYFEVYGNVRNSIENEPLHLPCLRRLSIHAKGSHPSAVLEEIFTHIITPGLSTLKIVIPSEFVFPDKPTLTREALRFLEGCSALNYLDLYRCGDVDLRAVLRAIPSLQTLYAFQSGALSQFAIQDILDGQCGLNLREVRCGIVDLHVKPFLQLLETQWDPKCDYTRSKVGRLEDVRLRVMGMVLEEHGIEATRLKQMTGSKYSVELKPYNRTNHPQN